MNVACDYEAPVQMLTTEKYIAPGPDTHSYTLYMHRSFYQGHAHNSVTEVRSEMREFPKSSHRD